MVAGYVETYLSYNTVIIFRQLVKNKVNQIVEIKKLQKEINKVLHQLKYMESLIVKS